MPEPLESQPFVADLVKLRKGTVSRRQGLNERPGGRLQTAMPFRLLIQRSAPPGRPGVVCRHAEHIPFRRRRGTMEMQTRCPKCTTIVRSTGTSWEILYGDCPELSGTKWKNNPEFCPTISRIVKPDVVLPGVTSRAAVQEEIERARIRAIQP